VTVQVADEPDGIKNIIGETGEMPFSASGDVTISRPKASLHFMVNTSLAL
jgi:hypothetical protein